MNWDGFSKILLKECPQDFVSYFVPGAIFVNLRETQFQTRPDSSSEPHEIRADVVLEANFDDEPFLIHVEWQSTEDKKMKMGKRLLGYNYEALCEHDLPVLSCVIYLQKVGNVPQAPLDKVLPTKRRVLWFDYEILELAEQTVNYFRRLGLDGFWPLALLAKDGATFEVLEEVLAHLKDRKELVELTQFFAGKVLTSESDRKRLDRRFAMLRDFLKDSWTYQATINEGREQEREEGLELTRRNIEALVKARFPGLLASVSNRIAQLADLAKLQEVLIAVSAARTADEIEKSLLALQ